MLMLAAVFVALVHPAAAAGQQQSEIVEGRAQRVQREYRARRLRASAQQCTANDMTVEELFEARLFGARCYALWIGCGNVSRHVAVIPAENAIGVQKSVVESAVAARLRAAGVYDDATTYGAEDQSELLIIVQLYGGRYEILFEFKKRGGTRDVYGFWQKATTWERERSGTHGGQGAVAMEQVRVILDEFMNEFLFVNEPACSRR